MADCGCAMEARNRQERHTLWIVLGINAFMFIFEMALGVIGESTGLVADSLDMFADASVYAISLYAVGRSAGIKIKAAKVSGGLQIFLALLVVFDVIRKCIMGSEPISALMMGVGGIALMANTACLMLIAKHRDGGIHMRASLIFSANDVIANTGVILSGLLVWVLGSRYPDLIIGSVIAGIVMRGGLRILKEAGAEKSGCVCG